MKSKWVEKLKNLVPGWVFEEEPRTQAVFTGMAAILSQIQSDGEANQRETFIDNATALFLDQHGVERNRPRFTGELDSPYRPRIKIIQNSSDCPAIKAIVDPQLIQGEATIIEGFEISNFLSRGSFLSRNIISADITYNSYIIVVDKQIPTPVSFFSREAFASREDT